jgi:anti-sigma factor RsiW
MYVSLLTAENLRKLFAQGGPMRELLLRFAESLAMAYMPSAYRADEWRVQRDNVIPRSSFRAQPVVRVRSLGIIGSGHLPLSTIGPVCEAIS